MFVVNSFLSELQLWEEMHEGRRDCFVHLFSSECVPGVTRDAGQMVAGFAPRRPQSLVASFRGAKSSHKAAAEIAIPAACRARVLLPAARKALWLHSGEQNLHTGRRRKSPFRRHAGRRFCSPPPAKPCGSVPGSKIFTQGGGGNPIPSAPESAPAIKKGY